jgi:Mor family transcriptional regulator
MSESLVLDDSYPEVLADIAREIHKSLMADPRIKLDHQTAAEIALGVTEHVRKNIGGVNVYIPRGHVYEATQREQQIYKNFTGDNHHVLAREHDLTEMRIRQIVAKVGMIERAKRQQNLF